MRRIELLRTGETSEILPLRFLFYSRRNCRLIAEIERCLGIDARRLHDVVEQHVVADLVHRAPLRIGMQPPARTELDARHAVSREMHCVRTGPPQERRACLAHDRALSLFERSD